MLLISSKKHLKYNLFISSNYNRKYKIVGYCSMVELDPYIDLSPNFGKKPRMSKTKIELLTLYKRIRKLPVGCEIHIYGNSESIKRAFNQNWVNRWKFNRWKNNAGKPIKNKHLWKRLYLLSKLYTLVFETNCPNNFIDSYNKCVSLAIKESKWLDK